ncbi:MAG: Ig-like domain-containing protein [Thalassospira sp.]|uniref:Ig-like domain-containing protein n=1 Tax=Thalassospira sp. TaxID=1912094 RepID=UPI003A83CE37
MAAENDSFDVNANRTTVILASELLANDNGAVSISSVQSSEYGAVSLDGDGNVLFTPNADYYGPAIFSYTADDGAGNSSTATVTIDVKATLADAQAAGRPQVYGAWDTTAMQNGTHVVTWMTTTGDIRGRVYRADGTTLSQELAISQSMPDDAVWHRVEALADGGFVVVAQGEQQGGHTMLRRFDAYGRPVGTWKELSAENVVDELPEIIALQDGGYVVVAQVDDGSGGGGYNTYGRRYDVSGNATSDLFEIATSADSETIANGVELEDGRLMLFSLVTVGQSREMKARLFSGTGYPLGTDSYSMFYEPIRQYPSSLDRYYEVNPLRLADGRIAVATHGKLFVYSMGAGDTIVEDLQINLEVGTDEHVLSSDLIALSDGGVFVLYTNGTEGRVYGQRYDASGNPVMGQVDFEDLGYGDEYNVTIEAAADGGAFIFYEYRTANGTRIVDKVHVDSQVTGDTVGPAQYQEVNSAYGDSIEIAANRTTVILASELLANDNGAVSISSVQSAGYGTVSLDGDGNVLFTPNADYYGPAIFSYTADDGAGNSSTATVTIDVKATLADAQAAGRPQVYGAWDTTAMQNGTHVVTWMTTTGDIRGRVYRADGTTLSQELAISQSMPDDAVWHRVEALADGGFVVVAQGEQQGGHTMLRRFDAYGRPVGTWKELSAENVVDESPEIIALQDGGYVVVAQVDDGSGGGGYNTYGRRYDVSGNATSDLFEIATSADSETIANGVELEDGRLMLFSLVTVGQSREMKARLFSGTGYPLGTDSYSMFYEPIRQYPSSLDRYYEVNPLRLADGRIAVATHGKLFVYSMGAGDTIVEDLQINLEVGTDEHVLSSDLIALSDGGVFVLYTNGTEGRVYGQRYDASGNPVMGQVDFEDLGYGDEYNVTIEAAADGGAFIFYEYRTANGTRIVDKVHVDSQVTGDTVGPAQYQEVNSAYGDSIEIAANRTTVILASELLANDNGAVSISSVQSAGYGTVSLDGDGNVLFTPNADYYGPAIFSYTADDGAGNSSTATVTIDVKATLADAQAAGRPQVYGAWDTTAMQNGTHVVTWMTTTGDIRGRVYRADGTTLSQELAISQSMPDDAVWHRVEALADGGFVVVAQGEQQGGHTMLRRFDAYGRPVGTWKELSAENVVDESPEIIALQDGGYVVVAQVDDGSGGGGYNTYGRRYDVSGNATSDLFEIATSADSETIANGVELEDGRLMLFSLVTVGQSREMKARLFSGTGYPLGTDSYSMFYEPIRQYPSSLDRYYEVNPLRLADGRIAVATHGKLFVYSMGAGDTIVEDLQINLEVDTDEHVLSSDLIALSDGGVFVLYTNGTEGRVYGQRYDASGNPVMGQVDFEDLGYGDEYNVTIEAAADGGAFIFYEYRTANGTRIVDKVHVDSQVTGDTVGPAQFEETSVFTYSDSIEIAANRTTVILASELLANDNGAVSISSVQSAGYGTVSLDGDGNVLFTPNADYYGPAIFSYTADDGAGNSSTATVTIDVKATLADAQIVGFPQGYGSWDTTTLSDGSKIVSWMKFPGGGIRGRKFNADGDSVGQELALSMDMPDSATWHRIEALAGGGFVVVVQGTALGGHTMARRFNDNGQPVGVWKDLSIDETVDQSPEIIALQDGGYVVVTQVDDGPLAGDYNTYGRRFDENGNATSALFEIQTGSSDETVANGIELEDGRLMLFSLVTVGQSREIKARLFSGTGYPLGSDSTTVFYDATPEYNLGDRYYEMDPVRLPDGRIALATGGKVYVYSTGPNDTIVEDFHVELDVGDQGYMVSSDIVALSDGGVFVVYSGKLGGQVYGQRYDAAGNPVMGLVDFEELGYGNEYNVTIEAAADGGAYLYYEFVSEGDVRRVETVHVDSNVTGTTVGPAQFDTVDVAYGDAVEIAANRTTVILASELLANDNGAVSISSVQSAGYGTVSLDGDGNVLFTPNADYYGPAIFSYTADDGAGNSSTATVTIDVKATLADAQIVGFPQGYGSWDTTTLSDGSKIVSWMKFPGGGIRGRKFNADGDSVGQELALSMDMPDSATWHRIEALAGGGFVVVVQGTALGGHTMARRFNDNGQPVGVWKDLSIDETVDQSPEIIALQDGGYVVVTQVDDGPLAGDYNTYGRRFDENGNATSALFEIQTGSSDETVANGIELEDGRLMLFSLVTVGQSREIKARLFSGTGYPLGSDSTTVFYDATPEYNLGDRYYEMDPVRLPDGRIALATGGKVYVYSTGPNDTIVEDFHVELDVGDQGYMVSSDIVALSDGGVFVVYSGKLGGQVYGQRYDAAGNPVMGLVDFEELGYGNEYNVTIEAAADGGAYLYYEFVSEGDVRRVETVHVDSNVTGTTVGPAQFDTVDVAAATVGNDVLIGSAVDDSLGGSTGNDILDGKSGNDTLSGGDGADTFVFGRGSDHDVIADAEAADTVSLQSDVTANDVWLFQQGDDLVIQLLGSQDSLTVADWYAPAAQQVGEIEVAGSTLDATNVQNLVDAMSVFGINDVAADSLDHNSTEFQNAQAVIAANWQSS